VCSAAGKTEWGWLHALTVSSFGQLVQPVAPHCWSEGAGAARAACHGASSSPGHWLMLMALSAPTPPHFSPALPVQVTLQPVDFGMVYGPKP